ncbi:HTH_Tnp_Tc3_2 domain-containing protein [Trichonephila clavipes]|nr:HTH_Tnp_Tc3_2 domain-containing protein [Trichonephila clavipes]
MNPDSISAVKTIVFVCGDLVENVSILPLFKAKHHSHSWCEGMGCHCLQYTVTPSIDSWHHGSPEGAGELISCLLLLGEWERWSGEKRENILPVEKELEKRELIFGKSASVSRRSHLSDRLVDMCDQLTYGRSLLPEAHCLSLSSHVTLGMDSHWSGCSC